jgi:hypothetical protein
LLHDQQKEEKDVSHSKIESTNELSYSQLQNAFENLQRQVVDTFKKLASNKRIFSHLETIILENKKNMEALKKYMIDIQKDKNKDDKPSWFGCESCYIWKK